MKQENQPTEAEKPKEEKAPQTTTTTTTNDEAKKKKKKKKEGEKKAEQAEEKTEESKQPESNQPIDVEKKIQEIIKKKAAQHSHQTKKAPSLEAAKQEILARTQAKKPKKKVDYDL